MAKVKFIHCGDNHLDMPFSSLGANYGLPQERRQELKENFRSIIELVKAEGAELLLIAGDLFEHSYVKKATINYINDLFKSIPDTRIVLIPGNHDPLTPNSFYNSFSWSGNLNILSELNPYVSFDELKVCVFGAGFADFMEKKALQYDIKPVYNDYINILMLHGTVDLNFTNNIYNQASSVNLNSMGMDYIALGHYHNRLLDIGGFGTVFNPGSPEPLGFDEPGDHGVIAGTLKKEGSSKAELNYSFKNMNIRYYSNFDLSITGLNYTEQVIEKLQSAIMDNCPENKDIGKGLFCVTLKGYLDKDFKVDLQALLGYFKEKTYLKIKDETTADYDFDEIVKEPGLKGLFARKIFQKLEGAGSEYEKKLLLKALYYGLEALDTGKIEL